MAVVGFLLYAFLGYGIVSKVSHDRNIAYDTFVLRYQNGTLIGEAFINDSLVCGWALGLLKYKDVPRVEYANIVLEPTKNPQPSFTYHKWCQINTN